MLNNNEKLAVLQFGATVLSGVAAVGEAVYGDYTHSAILGTLSGVNALNWYLTARENRQMRDEKYRAHNVKEIRKVFSNYDGDGEF